MAQENNNDNNEQAAAQTSDEVNAAENNTQISEPQVGGEETKAPAKKPFSPIKLIILVVCLGVFGFSAYKIIGEFIDGSETNQMTDDLWNEIRGEDGTDTPDNDDTGIDQSENEPEVDGTTEPDTSSTDKTDATDSDSTDSTDTTPPQETETEPGVYDDQTYEEEQQAEQNSTVTAPSYSVSRPSTDKTDDTSSAGTVISPKDINVSTIPYLKASNLKKLLNTNSDTKGWFYFPGSTSEAKGTPIDTAIVQTTDNAYYLSHSFDKSENINGWIYADYRNNMEKITSNYNTVLYGHARSYKMFGGLKDLNTAVEWYSNGYNHFIKINTLYDETVWQIFSWYETDVYYDYIQTSFESPEDFIRFAYEVQEKNQMTGIFETFEFSENDRILTLSTCKGLDRTVRVAVHAKLVRRNKLAS